VKPTDFEDRLLALWNANWIVTIQVCSQRDEAPHSCLMWSFNAVKRQQPRIHAHGTSYESLEDALSKLEQDCARNDRLTSAGDMPLVSPA